MKRIVLILVLIAVVAGGFGVWWYLIRDDAPPEATLVERETPTTSAGDGGAAGSPDGQWVIAKGPDTFVGFRITEHFTGGIDNTAVVRSPAATGSMTVAGTTIDGVTVEVDLTELESKDSVPPGIPGIENRIGQMQADGLEIATFPTATFALTEPITLAGAPTLGQAVKADATGELSIHGETQTVTIPVEARWSGDVIDVAGSLDVALADYGMDPPERPFVSVDEAGTMELQLTLKRSS